MSNEYMPRDRRKTDWGKVIWQSIVSAFAAAAVSMFMNYAVMNYKIAEAHAAIAKVEKKIDTDVKEVKDRLKSTDDNILEILRYLRK